MANEKENIDLNDALKLETTSITTLSTAVGLLSQIKGLVYEIARNPIAAPLAVSSIEHQIVNFINNLKKTREELQKINREMSIFKDPRTWTGIGSAALAVGFRIQYIKDELEKTRLSLYKIGGEKPGGAFGTGMANALGFTKEQARMQEMYGKQFVETYIRTVSTLQERLRRENMHPDKQKAMFEAITGLSEASGADFAKAIELIQDKLGAFNTNSVEVLTSLKMIEEAWLNQKTAIGSLNENIEAGTELISEFIRQGMRLPEATIKMLELNEAANHLHLTTNAMLDLFRNASVLQEFGASGVQARLKITGGLQTIPGGYPKEIKDILQKYKGLRPEEALFAMKYTEGGTKDYLTFMQAYLRAILPMKEGKVDTLTLAKNARQIEKEFFLPPGGLDTAIKLAEAEDVSKLKDEKSIEEFSKKLNEINRDPMNAFNDLLKEIVNAAGTWQDSMEALLKQIQLLVPQVGKLADAIEIAAFTIGGVSLLKGGKNWIKFIRDLLSGTKTTPTGGPTWGGGWTTTTTGEWGGGWSGGWGTPPQPPVGGGIGKTTLRLAKQAVKFAPAILSAYDATQAEERGDTGTSALLGVKSAAEGALSFVPGGFAVSAAAEAVQRFIPAIMQQFKKPDMSMWTREQIEDYEKRYGFWNIFKSGRVEGREEEKSKIQNNVNIEAKVFIDSEQIASRVEQKINQSKSTTSSKP
jgi:hypothetical protein